MDAEPRASDPAASHPGAVPRAALPAHLPAVPRQASHLRRSFLLCPFLLSSASTSAPLARRVVFSACGRGAVVHASPLRSPHAQPPRLALRAEAQEAEAAAAPAQPNGVANGAHAAPGGGEPKKQGRLQDQAGRPALLLLQAFAKIALLGLVVWAITSIKMPRVLLNACYGAPPGGATVSSARSRRGLGISATQHVGEQRGTKHPPAGASDALLSSVRCSLPPRHTRACVRSAGPGGLPGPAHGRPGGLRHLGAAPAHHPHV